MKIKTIHTFEKLLNFFVIVGVSFDSDSSPCPHFPASLLFPFYGPPQQLAVISIWEPVLWGIDRKGSYFCEKN